MMKPKKPSNVVPIRNSLTKDLVLSLERRARIGVLTDLAEFGDTLRAVGNEQGAAVIDAALKCLRVKVFEAEFGETIEAASKRIQERIKEGKL